MTPTPDSSDGTAGLDKRTLARIDEHAGPVHGPVVRRAGVRREADNEVDMRAERQPMAKVIQE